GHPPSAGRVVLRAQPVSAREQLLQRVLAVALGHPPRDDPAPRPRRHLHHEGAEALDGIQRGVRLASGRGAGRCAAHGAGSPRPARRVSAVSCERPYFDRTGAAARRTKRALIRTLPSTTTTRPADEQKTTCESAGGGLSRLESGPAVQ